MYGQKLIGKQPKNICNQKKKKIQEKNRINGKCVNQLICLQSLGKNVPGICNIPNIIPPVTNWKKVVTK